MTPEKFIRLHPDLVAEFLDRNPEFYETDILYCPDVFRQLLEETGM